MYSQQQYPYPFYPYPQPGRQRRKPSLRVRAMLGGCLLLVLAVPALIVGFFLTTGALQVIFGIAILVMFLAFIGFIRGAPFLFGRVQKRMLAAQGVSAVPVVAGKEKMHHWIWLGNVLTLGVAGWLLIARPNGQSWLPLVAVLIALSLLSLALSRFGTRWRDHPWWVKGLILLGVIAGLVVAVVFLLSGSEGNSGSDSTSDTGGGGGDSSSGGSSSAAQQRRQNFLAQLGRCPRCGQPIAPGARFCIACGLPLQ